jgi:hypothetical protein
MLGEWDSHCYSPSIAEQMTALCYSGRQQQVSVLVSIPWLFVFISEYLKIGKVKEGNSHRSERQYLHVSDLRGLSSDQEVSMISGDYFHAYCSG